MTEVILSPPNGLFQRVTRKLADGSEPYIQQRAATLITDVDVLAATHQSDSSLSSASFALRYDCGQYLMADLQCVLPSHNNKKFCTGFFISSRTDKCDWIWDGVRIFPPCKSNQTSRQAAFSSDSHWTISIYRCSAPRCPIVRPLADRGKCNECSFILGIVLVRAVTFSSLARAYSTDVAQSSSDPLLHVPGRTQCRQFLLTQIDFVTLVNFDLLFFPLFPPLLSIDYSIFFHAFFASYTFCCVIDLIHLRLALGQKNKKKIYCIYIFELKNTTNK